MSEKFTNFGRKPTPHERELLEILIEECAEVQQRATKALRFGMDEVQPKQPFNNIERLSIELGDLACTFRRMVEVGLVSQFHFEFGLVHKESQLAKYMRTTPETPDEAEEINDLRLQLGLAPR